MRASFILACGAVALASVATMVACAASGDEAEPVPPQQEGGGSALPDADVPDVDPGEDASGEESTCSEAGWCPTSLPDEDLTMKDIWPFPGRALAVAESPTLGIKVLEWEDAAGAWKYIDDGTQNEPGFGDYIGKAWAPNEDELYFGIAPGYVYHGKRPVPPATAWTWTRHPLESSKKSVGLDDGYPTYPAIQARYPALGVWGTSKNDVYAWHANTVYHFEQVDGGGGRWVAEYVADDPSSPNERLFFLGAAGTSADDVWFSGARSQLGAGCALVVRKTAAGYQKVADGVIGGPYWPCFERPGVMRIDGAEGWLTDIQAIGANQFLGLKGARDVVKISAADDGRYVVDRAPIPYAVTPTGLSSLWSAPGAVWLSGWGRVVRGTDVWDGGAYRISTISRAGEPINRPIFQVRGASNDNLWAIGARHAFHKTTP
ncbi:MAG: hypothetical protein J0I07_23945 [Myxococcales bacterium]|nr:hypothetical protein [Myxococcales bacterium]